MKETALVKAVFRVRQQSQWKVIGDMEEESVPISARDIVPAGVYDEDEVEEEQEYDDLSYDLYNLTASSFHPVRMIEGEDREDTLKEVARKTTQLLVKRIFLCPIEKTEVGPVAVLPEETTVLPRAKRVPEPKLETKWEKFAREKGIKKQKRERMVFDEDTQTYAPRYGYKRARDGVEEQAIVEVKAGQDPTLDPWSEGRKEKKERVKKNLKNQVQNLRRAGGASGKGNPKSVSVAEFDPSSVPGIPVDMMSKEGKRGKAGVRSALQLAQHSTASMGRFDERRDGEPEKKMRGKKRAFRDNVGTSEEDKSFMKAQMRIVADKVDKKARGVTNSLAAYEGIIPDAPGDEFRRKKGKSGAGGGSGAKPKNKSSGGKAKQKK